MSLLEHWDSDSMPVPILCHTIRQEREAARGRAGGSSACCDTQLPHSQVKRPDKHHRTAVQTEQTAQPSTTVPPCPPSSQHWDSWEMCWSQGQHGHGCQVMDKCTTPLVSPGCGSTHVPVVVGTARPGRGSSSCPSLPPKSLLSSLLPAPKQCLPPTATSSSQHGVGEGQPGAGHPHPKALKLATPVTPLHPKPATSAPLYHSLAPARGFIGSDTGEAASHTASKIPTHNPQRTGQGLPVLLTGGWSCCLLPASLSSHTSAAHSASRNWQQMLACRNPEGWGSQLLQDPTFPIAF